MLYRRKKLSVKIRCTLLAPIVLVELVVKARYIHAVIVLPYAAPRALDPGPLGCEVVFAADAVANIV